jgi:acyl carrier protein
MDIESQIRNFISKNLLYSDNGFRYSDDTSFLEEGIVDSIGVLELVAFVEDTYKFIVEDQDVTADNFDTVNRLAAYIKRSAALPV